MSDSSDVPRLARLLSLIPFTKGESKRYLAFSGRSTYFSSARVVKFIASRVIQLLPHIRMVSAEDLASWTT
jgi:hypothetical protein